MGKAERLNDRWRGHSDFVEQAGMDVGHQLSYVAARICGLHDGSCDAEYESPKAAGDMHVNSTHTADVAVDIIGG